MYFYHGGEWDSSPPQGSKHIQNISKKQRKTSWLMRIWRRNVADSNKPIIAPITLGQVLDMSVQMKLYTFLYGCNLWLKSSVSVTVAETHCNPKGWLVLMAARDAMKWTACCISPSNGFSQPPRGFRNPGYISIPRVSDYTNHQICHETKFSVLQDTTAWHDCRCQADTSWPQHEALIQWRFTVEPPSATLDQHKTKIGGTYLFGNVYVGENDTQKTQYIDPILAWCWSTVDGGPTLNQHRVKISWICRDLVCDFHVPHKRWRV